MNRCSHCGHVVEFAQQGIVGSGCLVYGIHGDRQVLCNYCLRAAGHPFRMFWRKYAPRFLVAKAKPRWLPTDIAEEVPSLPEDFKHGREVMLGPVRLTPPRSIVDFPAAGYVVGLVINSDRNFNALVKEIDGSHVVLLSDGLLFALDWDTYGWKSRARLFEISTREWRNCT